MGSREIFKARLPALTGVHRAELDTGARARGGLREAPREARALGARTAPARA